MSQLRRRRRLLFGWLALGSLLFVVVELFTVGFPGICGFTGGLLGGFADRHSLFGMTCFWAALIAVPLSLLSFIVWIVVRQLPASVVDPAR